MAEVEFGHKVQDSNCKILGVVSNLIRDTWSGDLKKFSVRNEKTREIVFYSIDDIAEVTESMVRLKESAKPD